jgi:hypothetical protein
MTGPGWCRQPPARCPPRPRHAASLNKAAIKFVGVMLVRNLRGVLLEAASRGDRCSEEKKRFAVSERAPATDASIGYLSLKCATFTHLAKPCSRHDIILIICAAVYVLLPGALALSW